MRKEMGKKYS